jgi:hypothetical protein
VGGTEVYRQDVGGGTRLVLIDRSGGDLTFQVDVADVRRAPGALVEEVAAPDDALRTDVGSYRVVFSR